MIKFTISLSKVNVNQNFVNCSPKEQVSVDIIHDDYYPICEKNLIGMLKTGFDQCLRRFYIGDVKEIDDKVNKL